MPQLPGDGPAIDIRTIEVDGTSGAETGRRRRPLRRMILTALAVVVVAVAVFIARVGWQMVSEKDARLSPPGTVGSLRLDGSDDGLSRAAQLRAELSAVIDLNATVGAVYLDGTGRNVLFRGGTKSFWAPGSVLDSVLEAVTSDEGAVATDLHSVDAGPLGGVMKCGKARTGEGDVTVCGWADHGTVALAMFNGRDERESAELLRQIRRAALTRS